MLVLEGTASVLVEDNLFEIPTGGWHMRPRGIVHTFFNNSDKTTRNAIRDLRILTDATVAGEKLPVIASMIDKLAKQGVIHKNKAGNLKSKLAKKVNSMAK